ncbi:hypothetical protein [Chryseobacterium indoltheticum]|nr:hypothetical protein [Chryseobacterium indoltheticum]
MLLIKNPSIEPINIMMTAGVNRAEMGLLSEKVFLKTRNFLRQIKVKMITEIKTPAIKESG